MLFIKIKKNFAGAGALSSYCRLTAVAARTGRHRVVGRVSAVHATPSRSAARRAFARGRAQKQTQDALPAARSWARIRKEVRVVKAKLRGLVTADEMNRWLVTHNSAFDGRAPLEAIHRGETERVLETLARLEQGIFV